MDVLIYIGKAAIALSLFYLVYTTLLKSETHFGVNRLFLASGLLVSFIIPLLQFTKTITIPYPENNLAVYTEDIPSQVAAASQQLDWWYYAGIVYLLITGIFLIRFLKQLFSLRLLLKKHTATTKNGFKHIATTEKILPFSFFSYIVYNPALHASDELTMILKHEEAHAYQKHSIDIVMANLLTVVQWANPLAWLYKKSIEENLEFIADNEAIDLVSSKKEYQVALVKASSKYPIPALTTNFYQSFTKKRIVMLNKKNSKRINVVKLITILPLLALFLWSFNINEKIHYSETENTLNIDPLQKSDADPSETQKNNVIANNFNSKINSSEEQKPTTSVLPSEKRNIVLQDTVKGIQLIITKNTTVEELEANKQRLKRDYGATLTYSNLKYNDKDEITGISISYNDKRGNNNNYSMSSDQPINDYMLTISKNGAISSKTVMTEAQKMERQKMMAKRDKMISKRNAEMDTMKQQMQERKEEMKERQAKRRNMQKERMEKRKQAMRARSKVLKSHRNDSGYFKVNGNRFHIDTDGNYVNDAGTVVKYKKDIKNEDPIYYVNGKETSADDIKSIAPENIKEVNVLKGKRALKKYGGKGVNGVVEIILKE